MLHPPSGALGGVHALEPGHEVQADVDAAGDAGPGDEASGVDHPLVEHGDAQGGEVGLGHGVGRGWSVADHPGVGQEHGAGAHAGHEGAAISSGGQQREPLGTLHLAPSAVLGPRGPPASGHDDHLGGTGVEDDVRGEGDTEGPGHGGGVATGQAHVQIGAHGRRTTEDFEGTDDVELVDARVHDDVDPHPLMVAGDRRSWATINPSSGERFLRVTGYWVSSAGLSAEGPAADLAQRRPGERGDELEGARCAVGRQLGLDQVAQRLE